MDLYALSFDLKNKYSQISQEVKSFIVFLYKTLTDGDNLNYKNYTDLFKKEFRFIYGDIGQNLSGNNKIKPDEIFSLYDINDTKTAENLLLLFYSIQTCFSILIKSVMYKTLLTPSEMGASNVVNIEDIVSGDFFEELNIKNYCNKDVFCWVEMIKTGEFYEKYNNLLNLLDKYLINDNFEDSDLNCNNNDYIKQMYECIIPKQLRHALGEYYTPDWLAQYTLKNILSYNTKDLSDLRFIDPTCGSGTFIFKTIQYLKEQNCPYESIINNVIGFDINPLAVLTAKTNFLLSILNYIKINKFNLSVQIPIYNVDVVNLPRLENNDILVPYCSDIYTISDYKKGKTPLLNDVESEVVRASILDKIRAFEIAPADVIIGNPPWINWEYVSLEYKSISQNLWQYYDLFAAKGLDLSFAKEDISVLVTYVVMDRYLKDNGFLAFVIRQGVFKSSQNGIGFRKFRMSPSQTSLKVLKVDDLSNIKVFDNAVNSSAILYIEKGLGTTYPVDYYLWKKRGDIKKLSINSYASVDEILIQVDKLKLIALPSIKEDVTSLWLTTPVEELSKIELVLGKNNYKARTGLFTGGANAVYWLNIEHKTSDNVLGISNINEKAKRAVPKVQTEIEDNYVYPLVQGSDINKWKVSSKAYILCPHTEKTKMWPVAQNDLAQKTPKTFKYLFNFKSILDSRKGFAGWEKKIQQQEFHSILRIGDYTFSKYKVAWRYIATKFICAVIKETDDPYLGLKQMIPNEKVMFVSTDIENEAYYLCGILSSTLISRCVESYMNPTSISAHILEKLKIFDYDQRNQIHNKIASLCKSGHDVATEDERDVILKQIDLVVEQLYEKREINIVQKDIQQA